MNRFTYLVKMKSGKKQIDFFLNQLSTWGFISHGRDSDID